MSPCVILYVIYLTEVMEIKKKIKATTVVVFDKSTHNNLEDKIRRIFRTQVPSILRFSELNYEHNKVSYLAIVT